MEQIEKYGVFELRVADVNQTEPTLECLVFQKGDRQIPASAFQNLRNEYLVRFMPDETGVWTYRGSLAGQELSGSFECVENTGNNHGRVVTDGYHFRYEDGERYIPFGTTCYAWIHQTEELQKQTLETLSHSPFNKVRMCVFPKSMPYNTNDPDCYPFEKRADGSWDVSRTDPIFWEKLDRHIMALMEMGIEVDLILFHPYDRWGFSKLSQQDSLIYLKYCVARLSAYRNIWWSLANEYEILYDKVLRDWDEYGAFLAKNDSYGHLRSVHNFLEPYPMRDWLTHCSIQSGQFYKIPFWRQKYKVPVIIDECGYEGDLPYGWGSLTAFEMVHRVWCSVFRGGFCTHGETYHRDDEVLWWAKGGELYGESWKRIAFLKDIVYSLSGEWDILPYNGANPNLDPDDENAVREEVQFQELLNSVSSEIREMFAGNITPMRLQGDSWYLEYFGGIRPAYCDLSLDRTRKYQVKAFDIWEMTSNTVADSISGEVRIPLPGKEGIAILVSEIKEAL